MSTKIIFLDIDGVLNDNNSKSTCLCTENHQVVTGIDSNKVKKLSSIVAGTGAIIVLTSSWKIGWERFKKDLEWSHAKYLDRKLSKYGLRVYDCTKEKNLTNRGMGIVTWLKANFSSEEKFEWIVLDDEIFPDFNTYNIFDHLIQTTDESGLTDEHVELAIKMLNKEED